MINSLAVNLNVKNTSTFFNIFSEQNVTGAFWSIAMRLLRLLLGNPSNIHLCDVPTFPVSLPFSLNVSLTDGLGRRKGFCDSLLIVSWPKQISGFSHLAGAEHVNNVLSVLTSLSLSAWLWADSVHPMRRLTSRNVLCVKNLSCWLTSFNSCFEFADISICAASIQGQQEGVELTVHEAPFIWSKHP